ncbi:MAG: hypothetical protein KatS3mg060_3617 [Dehalococcoidia bacterium]|nr:MAG: hypothetical protein KatS3mg060_3617 [Dehalococcoidia bacterium]
MERTLREPLSLHRSVHQRVELPRSGTALARGILAAAALLLCLLALAFWMRWPIIGLIWPAPVTNGTFLAAIAASIAAPVLFIVWTGDFGAVRAGAVTLGAIYAGFVLASLPPLAVGNSAFTPFVVVSAIAVAGNVLMFRWARAYPEREQQATPSAVLWFFAISSIMLVVPGVAALLGTDLMPSPQPIETLRLYGAIYAGAGAFFLWGIARPTWSNARLVLIAFLVYDALRLTVLPEILPRMLANPAGTRTASWIYWGAVIASALFCVVFLMMATLHRRRGHRINRS